jgi:predicted adenylyl cyclase CyaB
MARNVEIKAKVDDLGALRARVEARVGGKPEILDQEDVFFSVPKGRLKLRSFPGGGGELIAYARSDDVGPTLSTYRVYRTENPEGLKSFLSDLCGIRGIVRKRRLLYHIGRTRVHLDEVEGLGAFLELEVVLADEEEEADGERAATEILRDLGVVDERRMAAAYIDLLEEAAE